MMVTGLFKDGYMHEYEKRIFSGMEGKNIIPSYDAAGYGFQ